MVETNSVLKEDVVLEQLLYCQFVLSKPFSKSILFAMVDTLFSYTKSTIYVTFFIYFLS